MWNVIHDPSLIFTKYTNDSWVIQAMCYIFNAKVEFVDKAASLVWRNSKEVKYDYNGNELGKIFFFYRDSLPYTDTTKPNLLDEAEIERRYKYDREFAKMKKEQKQIEQNTSKQPEDAVEQIEQNTSKQPEDTVEQIEQNTLKQPEDAVASRRKMVTPSSASEAFLVAAKMGR
jgi:hypothetical protein